MKQVIFDKEHPNGIIVEVEDTTVEEEVSAGGNEPIKAFFEGLASADTNSIAKIRALAREFLNVGGE